jgi:coenzyme PQQ precursor peptide PqqA
VQPALQLFPLLKETMMTWETPQATTFRFGFEITMYIANR